MRITLIILMSGLLLGGCATSPRSNEKQITLGNFKTKILRGQTNQKEVMRLLGSPSITTSNAQGNPVWTYTRQAFDQKNQRFAGGITLYGGTIPSPPRPAPVTTSSLPSTPRNAWKTTLSSPPSSRLDSGVRTCYREACHLRIPNSG